MSAPTLSIVIATYNGARFLREQLDSIYAQTLHADEVLAVDDCSTDETVEILEEYHRRYGLKYVVNEHNLRVNANFEKALKLTSSDLIMFCDQDDVWMPNKIELMMDKMYLMIREESKNTNDDIPLMVTSRDTYVDSQMNISHSLALAADSDDFKDTILYHLSQGSASMFNRKTLEYIFPFPDWNTKICYDFHVGYIVAMIGRKYNMKESLMYYRVHGGNVTARSLKTVKDKSNFFRHRDQSVLPRHFINTFKYCNALISDHIPQDRLDYVNKIIKIADTKNPFTLLRLLFTTERITSKMRKNSIKNYLLNLILFK